MCADELLYLLCICNFIAVNVLIFVLRFDTAANVGTCLGRGVLVINVLYANSRITSFQKVQSLQTLKTFPKANNILLHGGILINFSAMTFKYSLESHL